MTTNRRRIVETAFSVLLTKTTSGEWLHTT